MVATAGSRRAEPSGTAHLSSLFILRSLLGSSSPCMPSDSFCGHLVSTRCQPTYISAPGRQFVDEAAVWHVESTAWMRSLREQSSQLAPCATQTSRALHASCVPEDVCGAFGCWLLGSNSIGAASSSNLCSWRCSRSPPTQGRSGAAFGVARRCAGRAQNSNSRARSAPSLAPLTGHLLDSLSQAPLCVSLSVPLVSA